MTFQDNLSSLIADLETILWDGQLSENPEVLSLLERVRYYLVTRQSSWQSENYEKTAETLTQDILTRLKTQITPWLQSLDNDLENLRHQRQSLLQEIQQLEYERQQMMSECLERLAVCCTQVISQPSSNAQEIDNLDQDSLSPSPVSRELSSSGLGNTVDSGLKTILDSLEQDLQTYADSLAQGIQRMHRLGQQGEAKFLAYFNRLQQQLEATVCEPTLAEFSNQRWYLGIDLTSQKLTAILFSLNCHSGDLLRIYPLEEIVNLWRDQSHDLDSPLTDWRKVLRDLNRQLIAQTSSLISGETELSIAQIMGQLQGILLVCPGQWTRSDRTQLQQIILDHYSLSTPDEIIWVPKAIAVAFSDLSSQQQQLTTLVVDIGKTVTEFALVNLQAPFSSLTSQQLAYGFQSIDQDIVCQFIYPQWQSQITTTLPPLQEPFPQKGSPDFSLRERLSQQLQVHPLGDAFLEAAQLTRLIIQQQDSFTSSIGQQSWGVSRQEFVQQIITPWLAQLNDTLNRLLRMEKISSLQIEQIIIYGEGIETIYYLLSPWLQEIFSQATIVLSPKNTRETQLTKGLIYIPKFLRV